MQSQTMPASNRLGGFDALRLLGALAVVFLHAKPFMDQSYANTIWSALRDFIIQFSRFAVPFFFAAAGFFLNHRLSVPEQAVARTWPYVRRILSLFLIWSAIYLLFPRGWFGYLLAFNLKPFYWHLYNSINAFISTPLIFLFKSTAVHLWFLPALAIASLEMALFVQLRLKGLYLGYALSLYTIGVLSDTYGPTPIGLTVDSRLTQGVCYAPLFIFLGWSLSKRPQPGILTAFSIATSGFLLQFSEAKWLYQNFNRPIIGTAFSIGTVPFGFGLIMLAYALSGRNGPTSIARASDMTLGVYLIHIWTLSLLLPLNDFASGLLWELGFPVLIFFVSLLIVFQLNESKMVALL